MKITKAHQTHIALCIDKYLTHLPDCKARYERGDFARADRVKNLQSRFNSDLLYLSVGSEWVCTHIYPYANDTHIATLLHRVCPKVTAVTA